MVKKKTSLGLILLLLMFLAGCQAQGTAKNVVYSKAQRSAYGSENPSHYKPSIQRAGAVKKAEAAFQQYFNIQSIDKSLEIEAVLIEDDGRRWMNPYWKLSWLGKDRKKPVYSAMIDAQSGEVVQLRYRPHWGHKIIYREDVLACRDTALAFIDKFALVKEAPLIIFEACSSYWEGIYVEFRYETDKFITLYFNEAGDVEGFEFSQRVGYASEGNDLQVNRAEAIKTARTIIKRYYGIEDTSGLIEEVRLLEGDGGKCWFVQWRNIAALEGRFIRYGAQIDALNGKVLAIEGKNFSYYKNRPLISKKKQQEIADRFLQQKNLSDYRFVAFDKDLGSLRYRNKSGSPLHVFVDNGDVCFLAFFELK